MSPTVLREGGYRFFFFSREETRAHVHVICRDGEAKFWLEPATELARNYRLANSQLREIDGIIGRHYGELRDAWERHFGG